MEKFTCGEIYHERKREEGEKNITTRTVKQIIVVTLLLGIATLDTSENDPRLASERNVIVQLFEWKWQDIAVECEIFLKDKGFGAVQISPPNENLIIQNRPWWERYQPVSYTLQTRSGSERDFADMVKRCNKVGIRIYPDIVINHMTARDGIGTAGNIAHCSSKHYPAVPYSTDIFNPTCDLYNYNDVTTVKNCELLGLRDLDQSQQYVRDKITAYMNHLIDLGVAGFRIDAAKHMWPSDLAAIYSSLQTLNTDHGFPAGSRPFIYQEVIDLGGEAVKSSDYISLGTVTEFKYGNSLGGVLEGYNADMHNLVNWGAGWGMLKNSDDALVFIDNHDTQRNGGPNILSYKKNKLYKMAVAFMLAHPYGRPRIMSSYAFDHVDQSPPHNGDEILSPTINPDGTCGNGWICEHRWRQIFNMVAFTNTVQGTELSNWWSDGANQVAWCRPGKGFIAFNNRGDLNQRLQTCLPAGFYCDVISGGLVNGKCTGKTICVENDGNAQIVLGSSEDDGVLAIHVNAKQT